MYDFSKSHVGFQESVTVYFTVGRESAFGIEKYAFDPISCFCKHTGYGQGITSIVAGPGQIP